MTSSYEFHQYWLNVDDNDVERFLKQLTLLPLAEIAEIVSRHELEPHLRISPTTFG